MNENNYGILSIYIIFGILILWYYAKMYWKYKKDSTNIWSNKGRNIIRSKSLLKKVYKFMILLSFVAGIYNVYYLTVSNNNHASDVLMYLGSLIFLIFSLLWAVDPYYAPKYILSAVFIGFILVFIGICINDDSFENSKKIAALVTSSIILIQTGIFDLGLWSGIIKKLKF